MNPMRARMRALAGGVTRIDVFDDIGPGGFFSDGLTAKDFAARLDGVSGPLDVHVNSAGGDVSDGIAIGNAIRGYKGPKRTVVDGLAASIASVIAQAGDERIVEPGSMIMVHDPFTGIVGNAAELRKTAETLDKHGDNLAQIYASRAGGTPAHWRDVMQAETWFTAEEAVAAGLADRVGTGSAALPDGLDLAAFGSVPGRIAAALRSMPRAAAAPDTGDEDEDGSKTCPLCDGTGKIRAGHVTCPECHGTGKVTPAEEEAYESRDAAVRRFLAADAAPMCKTCKGKGRLKHPVTGKNSVLCPSCKGNGTYPPPDDSGNAGTGGAGDSAWRVRALAGDTPLGNGWVRGANGKVRFDPDDDGDDDSTPEGDSDHDYFDKNGKQIKPIPPCPPDAPSGSADVRLAVRAELRAAGLVRNSIPDDVKSTFLTQVKEDSTSDVASAIHRLSQWAGSGHYPEGTTYDDLKWFYDQCAAELQSRDPKSEAGGNFPPEPKSSAALPARFYDCRALTNALAAIAKAAGGSKDAGGTSVSGGWLEQVRAVLPPLKGARA